MIIRILIILTIIFVNTYTAIYFANKEGRALVVAANTGAIPFGILMILFTLMVPDSEKFQTNGLYLLTLITFTSANAGNAAYLMMKKKSFMIMFLNIGASIFSTWRILMILKII